MLEVFTRYGTGGTAWFVGLVRVITIAFIGDGRAVFGQHAFTLGISDETRLTEAPVDAHSDTDTTCLFHVGAGRRTGTTAWVVHFVDVSALFGWKLNFKLNFDQKL